jgi:hypothetical protein
MWMLEFPGSRGGGAFPSAASTLAADPFNRETVYVGICGGVLKEQQWRA